MGYDYYGNLKNGGEGWNTNKSSFIDGGILDASESGILGGHLYDGTGGAKDLTGSINSGFGGVDLGGAGDFLLGGSKPDGNGGTIKTNGALGSAFSAFNTYNAWAQGNKMYDLQKDAFDFSKDKFWNNYAQQTDILNRQRNKNNRQVNYKRNTMGMSDAEKNTYYQNIDANTYKGDATYEVDGSRTTVGQTIPDKYNQSAHGGPAASSFAAIPTAGPVSAPVPNNGPRAIAAAPTQSHAPSQSRIAPRSSFVGEKPKKVIQ